MTYSCNRTFAMILFSNSRYLKYGAGKYMISDQQLIANYQRFTKDLTTSKPHQPKDLRLLQVITEEIFQMIFVYEG